MLFVKHLHKHIHFVSHWVKWEQIQLAVSFAKWTFRYFSSSIFAMFSIVIRVIEWPQAATDWDVP